MLRTFGKLIMFGGLIFSSSSLAFNPVINTDRQIIWQLDDQGWTYTGKPVKKDELIYTIKTSVPATFKTNTLDLITKELVRLPFIVNQSKNK